MAQEIEHTGCTVEEKDMKEHAMQGHRVHGSKLEREGHSAPEAVFLETGIDTSTSMKAPCPSPDVDVLRMTCWTVLGVVNATQHGHKRMSVEGYDSIMRTVTWQVDNIRTMQREKRD